MEHLSSELAVLKRQLDLTPIDCVEDRQEAFDKSVPSEDLEGFFRKQSALTLARRFAARRKELLDAIASASQSPATASEGAGWVNTPEMPYNRPMSKYERKTLDAALAKRDAIKKAMKNRHTNETPFNAPVGDGDTRRRQKWICGDGCESWPIGIRLAGAKQYFSLQDWREIVEEATAEIKRQTP